MKAAGYLTKIDGLGRIVVPKQLRDKFDLEKGSRLELFTENDMIVMKKYRSCCVFCGSDENITSYMDKHICGSCLEKLSGKS